MEITKQLFLGHQTTVDLYGCNQQLIDDLSFVEKHLLAAASLAKLTIVNTTLHKFSPIGVSGVIVIAESHIAIHTWPEHGYVALDFFTCNEAYEIEKSISYLQAVFQASSFETTELKRGVQLSKTLQ